MPRRPQLEERQQGNAAYRAGDMQAALRHYTRGLAVLRLLRPAGPQDQALLQEAAVSGLKLGWARARQARKQQLLLRRVTRELWCSIVA